MISYWIVLPAGVLGLLATTSFFSQAVLWGLHQFQIEVNPTAAVAHETGALIEEPVVEPGSIDTESTDSSLSTGNTGKDVQGSPTATTPSEHPPNSPSNKNFPQDSKYSSKHLSKSVSNHTAAEALLEKQILGKVNDSLPARYLEANTDPQIHHVAIPNASATIGDQTYRSAQAIVVLGGGLGRDRQRKIIVNQFTRLRLGQAIVQHQVTGLPILLSGVEAPYMQEWLLEQGITAKWLENRSMNTCENARFTALMLQKQGGAAQIELITDRYHMPRAQRQFALNGIETVPVIAPLPGDPSPWWMDQRNLVHSRRALYELVGMLRDIWFGDTNCREVP